MSKHKKNKRARLSGTSSSASKSRLANRDTKEKSHPRNVITSKTVAAKKQRQQSHPVLQPFNRRSDVLLVGEGDFSFARALSNGIPLGPDSTAQRRTDVDGIVENKEDDYDSTGSKVGTIQVRTITATSLDSAEEVRRKYPAVIYWLDELDRCRGEGIASGRKAGLNEQENADDEDEFEGFSPFPSSSSTSAPDSSSPATTSPLRRNSKPSHRPPIRVHHAIDATRIHTYKALRHPPPLGSPQTSARHVPRREETLKGFTHILFNFPHVGGLSTDRARQIRANQLLLIEFFRSAKPLLRPRGSRRLPVAKRKPWEEPHSEEEELADEDGEGLNDVEPKGGRVIISVFEGDPYDSWGVRALAKSAGFEVERSGRFEWELWGGMGYAHARTLGVLRSKNEREGGNSRGTAAGSGDETEIQKCVQEDDEDDMVEGMDPARKPQRTKRKNGWKGEERAARMYVFKLREPAGNVSQPGTRTKMNKRRLGEDSESD